MRSTFRFTQFTRSLVTALSLLFLIGCANKEEQIAKIERNAEDALFDGNVDEAVDLLSKGIKKHKNSARLHQSYGQALADNQKYLEAAEAIEKAIELDPTLENLWVNVGEYYALAGNNPLAIEALDKYVELNSDDFLAWKNLAILKGDAKDTQGAIDAALTWNKLRPSSRPALLLGNLFLESQNTAQARSWFAQAAAYVDESQAKDGLLNLIQLEADSKQYLQAETRISEYEKRYGLQDRPQTIKDAEALVQRWREAQAELARAGEDLQKQRRELEEKRLAMLKKEEEAKKKAEEERLAMEEAAQAIPDSNSNETTQPQSGERAPVPLFGEEIATDSGTPAADTTPVAQTTANPSHSSSNQNVGIENLSLDDLWNYLGDNPQDGDAWYQQALNYSQSASWVDAENCILQARQLNPLSERIAAEYLKIISFTQSNSFVLREATKLKSLFPRNATIALVIARQLKDSNSTSRRINRAYQSFLELATPNSEGYQEAINYTTYGQ